jgi:hypothetical protein
MTQDQGARETRARIFRGSQYWIWNTWGATAGALVGFVFMQGEVRYALRFAPDSGAMLAPIVWELLVVIGFLVSWPGNMIAIFPYEVDVEDGKGIRLHAVLKQVYIPIEDIRDVRKSFLQGYVVRLKRRHRLLQKFVIHRFFGSEGEALANAVQDEIRRAAI